jgi:hypothetical protein
VLVGLLGLIPPNAAGEVRAKKLPALAFRAWASKTRRHRWRITDGMRVSKDLA